MIKILFGTAALALAIAATPASAQLLGGGGGLGGALGGGVGGTIGSIGGTGSGAGSIGGRLGDFPVDTASTATSRTSSHTDRSVNPRKGRVSASNSSSADSAIDNQARIGKQSLTGKEDGTRIVPRQPKENGTPPAARPALETK